MAVFRESAPAPVGEPSLRSPWVVAFAALTVVHLVLNAADATPWDSITKCVLAPLLIGWVIEQKGPRLLAAALAFCLLGDLLLELPEELFVAGMAAFAAAHLCFIRFFVQRGAIRRLRERFLIVPTLLVLGVLVVVWVWSGLDPGLQPVIPVYALLLVGTAATALASDLRAGAGGVLFLVSDGIIAAAEAGRVDGDAPLTGLAVMGLYLAAIFLLTSGILAKERRTLAAGPDFDPARRTDCWPRLPA